MFGCSREAKHIAYRSTSSSMLLLCGVHMPPAILSCWSLFRVGLLVGFVVAVGGRQHVIVVPNFFFQLFQMSIPIRVLPP